MNSLENVISFIKKSPKSELHLHIEGSLEPELMFKLSKRNKIEIPFKSVEEIRSAYNFTNLDSFLKIYYEGSNVLINEEDFFDLTWEYILRCKQDNIVHTEIFFDPQSHIPRGVNFDKIINGIDKALKKAEKDFNITSKIIMCFLRHLDEESCFDVLKNHSKSHLIDVRTKPEWEFVGKPDLACINKQTFFISNNVNDLMNDISKGEGDYLFAYGELLGCSGDMKYFSKHLKVNFDLVIQDGAIAKDILLNTKRVLNDSNRLKKICIPAA